MVDITVSGAGDVTVNGDVSTLNVNGDGAVTVNNMSMDGGIGTVEDGTTLPTDGSVLEAWVEPAGGIAQGLSVNWDRVLVAFTNQSADPASSYYTIEGGVNVQKVLPDGWQTITSGGGPGTQT